MQTNRINTKAFREQDNKKESLSIYFNVHYNELLDFFTKVIVEIELSKLARHAILLMAAKSGRIARGIHTKPNST